LPTDRKERKPVLTFLVHSLKFSEDGKCYKLFNFFYKTMNCIAKQKKESNQATMVVGQKREEREREMLLTFRY